MTPGSAHEPPDPPRGVVLIGLRRSGKTSVGALLARRLGRELLDTDAWCEEEAGPISSPVAPQWIGDKHARSPRTLATAWLQPMRQDWCTEISNPRI